MKKTFFLIGLLLGFVVSGMVFTSCGDDEVGPGDTQGKNAEQNTTDVAVTGSVNEVSAMWAQISGVVNLDLIASSYTNVSIGVELSETEDFKNKNRTKATDVVGRKFNVHIDLLMPESKYYYRTYVEVSSLSYVYLGETYSFTTKKHSSVNGHYYVDLDLPSGTLWATCNVGATSPEGYGSYFAWGETVPKDTYNWSTYTLCNGTSTTLTKYCNNSSSGYNGFTDTLTELEPEDDAAYVNWGSGWRMPSLAQFEELINSSYTTTTWTTLNGVYGRKITSISNGNSIFLPAAGYRYGSSLNYGGSLGYYWSRTLGTSSTSNAYDLYFVSSNVNTYYINRYYGESVRPVRLLEQ